MNAFLLIFGAVVLAVGVAAGRYFAGGKGWKWVNTTDDKDRYDEKAVLRFLSKCMYALGGCFGGVKNIWKRQKRVFQSLQGS